MDAQTPGSLSGVRVLVVEDGHTLRELIRWVLELEGATVVEARTAREALALAADQAFDIALTDLGLPDLSGEVVVSGVRAASQGRTPVAVVSGAHADALARALEAGAERVFPKPVDWDDLIRYLASKRRPEPARRAPLPRPAAALTVLVVDDDNAMRALLRDVLERAGHRVIDRPDGADLPALAERARIDAVILDNAMPGPSGLDLLSFLRRRRPAVPVILVTAFGGPDVAAEAARRGAYRYLEKPFRVSAILDCLAAASMTRGLGSPWPAG